jgi:hypothetical protein
LSGFEDGIDIRMDLFEFHGCSNLFHAFINFFLFRLQS